MIASATLYLLLALNGAAASPVHGPEVDPRAVELQTVEPRAIEPRMPSLLDIPFPKFPTRNRNNNMGAPKDCATSSQMTACSGGNPYCCSSDGNGGHICANTTACTQTIICCNNNNGFQICIGDLDFNVPITINVYT